jgi:protein-L-isoaspartate(D-aspartate) O-methyltransferase
MQPEAEAWTRRREEMVARQIAARGVRSPRVLAAMRRVRREGYVPSYLGEFAYEDSALPIEEEQTISQPYIVAFMIEALDLEPNDRVLEIGTGSGYAAAVLAELCRDVCTIERHERLAKTAAERLRRDGYTNVRVRHGDGTLGWPDAAPFDAIVVAAGGPEVPESLKEQLAIGGRLVIPVGTTIGLQELVRVRRTAADRFRTERLGGVRFVPLIGAEGWREPPGAPGAPAAPRPAPAVARLVAEGAEPFRSIDGADLAPLLDRIGDARVVLLGEATHGTSEFYRMRARITRELIARRGFTIVAAEADWADAARVDHFVRERTAPPQAWQAFARFPTWMWRNRETREFVDWLARHNRARPLAARARFAGLDLYGLHVSIAAVLRYLDDADPAAAQLARHRYGCLQPWGADPAAYGRAALTGQYESCEAAVVSMLEDLLRQRLDRVRADDERFFEMIQNARVVAGAEAYYRVMYYGAAASWNLRDRHMFACLSQLLEFHGPEAKAVVWAHNSHIGDARATAMSARGELNIGQLCREEFGDRAYLVGFGTDRGTVAAASYWGGEMECKRVRPSLEGSYERLCRDSGVPAFLLPLRHARSADLRQELARQRLQRAIGVIYRPETERHSHYFHAELPRQFDEYVWFDETHAVQPLETRELQGMPETYPFGV